MEATTNRLFPENEENFLTSCGLVSFSGRTLFLGVSSYLKENTVCFNCKKNYAIMAAYSEIHKENANTLCAQIRRVRKYTLCANTLCAQNTELLIIKLNGTHS